MKTYRYVKLDPTGNTTCLVLDPTEPQDEKAVTRKLLEECEQVAYLEAPTQPGAVAAIRLMGGEFCGNAAMAAAAWLVREELAEGEEKALLLQVSGAVDPVRCTVRKTAEGFEGTTEMPPVQGEVTFDHVSFAYANAPEVQVLRDVSFTVKPGQTIALVGPTGAGKSTIVNLVSRFYDVTEGSVRIDGRDVRDVTLHSLRSQMGVMTQENFLFTGTVRDNILYGNPEATEEEMIQASKAVHAHEYIMKLPDGYDTKISERGGSLSAGQRQLIAFARAMLSMPAILVLDEATASIDTHTELLVQQGIEGLLKGRTSFVVAHRLSTIRKADCIFVIDDGMIKEAGSHEQLMEQQGAYYRLYQAQFTV